MPKVLYSRGRQESIAANRYNQLKIKLMKKIIFILFSLQIGLTFAQSKKEQIEILKMRTDSLTNVLDNERKINIIKVQALNSSIEIKKNQINAKSVEVDDLKHQLKNKSDCLKIIAVELKKIKESIQIKSDATKSYNTLDYDFDETNSGDFDENYDTIIIKEKTRMLNSNYAKRDLSLKIKLVTGETISLGSISEHEGIAETHFTYLHENELRAKLYYVMINYWRAGGGSKRYTLIEIDLKTGEKNTLVSNIGGNFNFNENETYLLVSGWYDSQEYVNDNQLQVINIVNKKIDLVIKDVEPIKINWLSDFEFQCQLLKYSKEKEWPNSRIPSAVRTGNLNKYKFNNGFWSKL